MTYQETLATVLTAPTPDALWRLQGDLMSDGLAPDAPVMAVLDAFYQFLNELLASSTSREYSHFASILDIGAVGGVAVQNLLESRESEDWGQRLLLGGLSESLMILAARQYVKAWENEMSAVLNQAAWFLFRHYWQLSAGMQPDLSPEERRTLVDQLLAPVQETETSSTAKAILLGRLFQILLVATLVR